MAEASSVEQLQHQETAVQLEVRGPPLSVTDRYYTKHYAVGKGCSREGWRLGEHANKKFIQLQDSSPTAVDTTTICCSLASQTHFSGSGSTPTSGCVGEILSSIPRLLVLL